MKIRTRFTCSIGLILLLLLSVGFMCIHTMRSLSGLTFKMHQHPFTVSNALRDVKINIIAIHETMDDLFISSAEADKKISEFKGLEEKIYLHFELIQERFLGDRSQVTQLIETFEDWRPLRAEVIRLLLRGVEGQDL